MKKTIIIVMAITLFATMLSAQSKQVFQQVFDVDGESHPNPEEDGAITFEAWISSRPSYILTEESTGSNVGMSGGRFLVQVNAGNFPGSAGAPVDWTAGEMLTIVIKQQERELIAENEIELTQGSAGIFMYGEDAIALRPEPTVLFDSNEDDLVTTTAEYVDGYDPSEDGVYRAVGWEDDRYFAIEFSTMEHEDIRVRSLLRRQFVGEAPPQPRGPKYFKTYFSIDEGENWVEWGNPEQNNDEYYHVLPDDEGWFPINIQLPPSAAWKENVMVKWENINDQTNQDGWAEIMNVIATGDDSEEPPYAFYPPNNLTHEREGYNLHLSWREPAPFEHLSYDEDNVTAGQSWEGVTMGTQMSPEEDYAQILSVSYYTFYEGEGDSSFEVEIYGWAGNVPARTPIYTGTYSAVADGWVDVELHEHDLFVTNDFLVGFGSVNETTGIGVDEELETNRAWYLDPSENEWYGTNNAYIIRAVVLYPDDDPAVIYSSNVPNMQSRSRRDNNTTLAKRSPVNNFVTSNNDIIRNEPINYRDDLEVIGYNVYRNGEMVNEELVTEMNYSDENLEPDNEYSYYVTAVYTYNQESVPSLNTLVINLLSAEDEDLPVLANALEANYPNPFNPTTTINFSIKYDEKVSIDVFNSRGQRVTTLVDDHLQAGRHNVVWNGRDNRNREVGSGVYFYRIESGEWTATEKMLLVK